MNDYLIHQLPEDIYNDWNDLCQTCQREPNRCKCAEYGEDWLKDHYPLAKLRGKADNYKPIFTTLECELIWDTDWYYQSRFPRLFRVWEDGKLLSPYGYSHPEFEILGEWFLLKHYLAKTYGDPYTRSPYTEKPKDSPEHFLFKIDWTLMYVPGYPLSKGDCVLNYNKPTEKQWAMDNGNMKYLWQRTSQTMKVDRSVLDIPLEELRAKGVVHFPYMSYPHYPNPITLPFLDDYRKKQSME